MCMVTWPFRLRSLIEDKFSSRKCVTVCKAGFSSVENMSRLNKNLELSVGFACARYVGTVVSGFIGLLAYASPIVMIVLPKSGLSANMTLLAEGVFWHVVIQCWPVWSASSL